MAGKSGITGVTLNLEHVGRKRLEFFRKMADGQDEGQQDIVVSSSVVLGHNGAGKSSIARALQDNDQYGLKATNLKGEIE